MEVTRDEFEKLRTSVEALKRSLHATRVTLQGEQGNNGVKESVNRAHSAIAKLQSSVKIIHDALAELALTSHAGDKDMEIMVLNKLSELNDKMDKREEQAKLSRLNLEKERRTERRWRIGQIIVVALFIAGVLLGL